MGNSTNPFITVPRTFDRLEPAMNPDNARTKNVKLQPSVTYAQGQIVGQVIATPGLYGKPGAGVQGPYFPLVYPGITDANGEFSLGPAGSSLSAAMESKFASPSIYWKGAFYVKDLVGVVDDAMLAKVGNLVQGVNLADVAAIVALLAGG